MTNHALSIPSEVPLSTEALKSPSSIETSTSRKTAALTDSARSFASSQRSAGSYSSSAAAAASPGTPGVQRSNLIRKQKKDRDPKKYYEVVKLLGFGSMGSVAKVKKRESVVGGSSRRDYVKKVHGWEGYCFSLPIVGDILRSCTGKDLGHKIKRDLFVKSASMPLDGETSSRQSTASSNKPPPPFQHSNSSIIGGGGSGSVGGWSGRSSITSKRANIFYALKTILMDRMNNPLLVQELYNEIDILKTLDHPNIVRPIETFNYKNQTCIVMELCEGGDLFARDPYSEMGALQIVKSVLSAVEYMHSKNIVHRDLKFENIMFCDKSPTSDVKVIDFGLSKKYLPTDHLKDSCGTIYTMAPEVLSGDYNQEADLWSLGVITYMLLSSSMPFFGTDLKSVAKKIRIGKYNMGSRKWHKISTLAKDFVRMLLVVDPNLRPSARDSLRHDWIRRATTITTHNNNNSFSASSDQQQQQQLLLQQQHQQEMDHAMASMEIFADYSKLKKLALMVIAHKSTSEDIGFLRRIFDKYDMDLNGVIERTEFTHVMQGFGYNENEIDKVFTGCDLDGTGSITYTEFLAATIEAHGVIDEEALAEAFDRMDSDDTGYISTHNLREILGDVVSSQFIEDIILEAESKLNYEESIKKQIDAKPAKDHFISYEEFMALWDQEEQDKKQEALAKINTRRSANHDARGSSSLQSIQESAPVNSITIDVNKDEADISKHSDLSFDLEEDPIAVSQFQGEKMMSVRKYADI